MTYVANRSDELFLMTNVRARSSGLPMNVWIGPRGHAQHVARIKVQMDHREQFDIDRPAAVTVEDQPRIVEGDLTPPDLELVRRFIAINRTAILDHWNERTDGIELARALRRF